MQAHAYIVLPQFQFMLFTKAESVAFVMNSSNFSLLLGQKKKKKFGSIVYSDSAGSTKTNFVRKDSRC